MRISTKDIKLNQRSGFVVFEGVNGAGKSTLLKRTAEHIRSLGRECIETREPGGTGLGKTLRKIVQESPELLITPMSELFLFAADRYEHVEKLIRPSRAHGKWVLSDRYFYSTIAFQGYGRGISLPIISQIMELAIDGERPDLVVLVDLDPRDGLRRIGKRDGAAAGVTDTFERENIEFHKRIRDGFLEIAETSPDPFLVLDGSRSPDEIFSTLKDIFQ